MRPSAVARSDMPGPKVYNLWWGDKTGIRQSGVISYTVSPFRQRAAKGMVTGYIMNGYRRLAGQFVYWSIPFAMGYSLYAWAKRYDAYQISKVGHIAAMEREGGEHH